MSEHVAALTLVLMLLVAALSVIARRYSIPSPLLMLLAGTAIAFVPGMPATTTDPEIVLLGLLPPLLYSSGVSMSWRGFRSNLRPILLLAIGCVLFTAGAVALVTHYVIGLSWPVGFVLGAVVSPPDAVAPMAILRRLRLPRRLVTILEGESLVNDATALVTLSFAVAALATGTFSPVRAGAEFVIIAVGEILFGIAIGAVLLRIRHVAADARAEVLLAIATPYLAFWPPHAAGGSGVIACVVAGLYVSWHGRRLIRPDTRLQGYFIWDLVVWATEAVVFLLAGLQARAVLIALSSDAWLRAFEAGLLVTVTVIVVRFVWVYPATYIPRWIFPTVCRNDPLPDPRLTFFVAFSGLRGAMSLVAALLVPAFLDGRPFPDRDIVLFCAYSVTIATLVGLGGAMPFVARRLGIDRMGAREAASTQHDEHAARVRGLDAMQARLTADGARTQLDPELAQVLEHEIRLRARARREALAQAPTLHHAEARVRLALIEAERAAVNAAYEANELTDAARRRIERELDLEEARWRDEVADPSAH